MTDSWDPYHHPWSGVVAKTPQVHIRDSYSYLLTVVDGLEVGLQMGFAVIHVDGDAIERGQPGHVSRGI